MNNILVINGHEYFPYASGKLNETIFKEIIKNLRGAYNIKTSIVQDGYNIDEEIEKFKWADTIIYQTPIYWFSLPGAFKYYIDRIYRPGTFFGGGERYGDGGLFKGKKYMFSITWNAPKYAFNDSNEFFEGHDIEGAINHLHYMNKYCGMEPFSTFSAYNVVKNPDINNYVTELRSHLKEIFDV